MTETPVNSPPPARSRGTLLALALATLALVATGLQWISNDRRAAVTSSELGTLNAQLQSLANAAERRSQEIARFQQSIGHDLAASETLITRLGRLEDTVARLPGGGAERFLQAAEQAEEYLRAANVRENLARDSAGALVSLTLADQQLQAGGDPRFAPVRRLIAREQAAIRELPRVDSEGVAVRIDLLSQGLAKLARRQAVPAATGSPAPATAADVDGLGRAIAAVRAAFDSLVTIRRTPEPTVTLLPDEAQTVLVRSLELELQIARLALLQGEAASFRAALAATRRGLTQYFDTSDTGVAAALTELDALGATPLPDQLPDISGSLTALVRLRETGYRP
jgi:uroporphyrin-3 C-methyltransferase